MPYVFNPFTGNFDFTAAGVPTLVTGGVTFGGTSGELAQDALHFNYNSTSDILSVSSGVTERITNGTFTGNASGWTLGAGWTYSSNSVSHSSNGVSALTQSVSVAVGERYEISFTISNLTVGTVTVSLGGVSLGTYSANGTYTARIVILNTSVISFVPSNTARLTIDNVSAKLLTGGTVQSGNLLVEGSGASGVVRVAASGKSNAQPGTTRHVLLENSGSDSWIDFKFSNVDKAHIGANSSGQISTYVSGGNYDAVYNKSTNSLISFNTPNTFTHYGYGAFQTGVNAGGITSPSSTLMSQGGTALKVKYITANQTLDNTATEWIVDPSAAACNGAPTNACSSYTSEFDCLARDAHGGCSWFAGNPCSVYNGDQSSCENTTGCTWEQASCSSFGDESTCIAVSGCSWNNNPQDCSPLDEATCGSTSGCTQNFDDCANYSDGGGDGAACNAANGGGFCSYDSGSGACTGGSWFVSCSGTYDSYSCDGTYATGNCTGTYGAACSGTASCGGIDDQTNCNNEPGCNWATAISLTLPSITSCPDRDYWIYNASSTNADVVIVPAGSETIDHTTSYTLSNFKDWVHISPFYRTASCGAFNQATCASTSGCSQNFSYCVWNYDGSVCEGDPACSSYGDQASCDAATYYSGCSGNYVVSSNWYVLGK
jgi:hypothetical protein